MEIHMSMADATRSQVTHQGKILLTLCWYLHNLHANDFQILNSVPLKNIPYVHTYLLTCIHTGWVNNWKIFIGYNF